MKILVLASGGDAPGMNNFLYYITKAFKKDAYACKAGFKGLIEGRYYALSELDTKKYKNCAGCIVKSSRCPEFKTPAGFSKGLENAKKFDLCIILGGNGSEKGAEKLAENGVRTIFVPATIDNDVKSSEYSIGFHTAVRECCHAVEAIMPSMEAFSRACIFETMGRHDSAIAKTSAGIISADYLIGDEKDLDYDKIAKIINRNYKGEHSTSIILRENIVKKNELMKELSLRVPKEILKYHVIGHTQRGGKPSKVELKISKKLAKKAINFIKKSKNSGKVKIINFIPEI